MPPSRRLRAGSFALALLLAAGCGSGDDEPAADEPAAETTDAPADEPADEPGDEPADEPGDEPADEPGDEPADDALIVIDDLDDLPDGCVDLFVDFMKQIEPSVEGIDFETATLGDLSVIGEEVEGASTDFAARSTELGCEQYDPESEDTVYQELLGLARSEAPGAVGFYEFLNSLAESELPAPDAPQVESAADCADAIATVEGMVDEYGSYNDVPMSELDDLGATMTTITGACTLDASGEFFARADISAFFTG